MVRICPLMTAGSLANVKTTSRYEEYEQHARYVCLEGACALWRKVQKGRNGDGTPNIVWEGCGLVTPSWGEVANWPE